MSDLRLVTAENRPALEHFLHAHAPIAMWPSENLGRYGMSGGHPKSMTFWMNAAQTDVLSQNESGMVFPVFTTKTVTGIASALKGRRVTAVVGSRHSVQEVRNAVTFPQISIDRMEPHFELDLNDLSVPVTDGFSIVPLSLVSRDQLIKWRSDYVMETMDVSIEEALIRATQFLGGALESNAYRVLMEGQVPRGLTGFNTQLPDIVMIGGVYTPKEYRGRGYASKAVALHLLEARAGGISRAVLSAANEPASRAYERIGFEKVGEFQFVFFEVPTVMHG